MWRSPWSRPPTRRCRSSRRATIDCVVVDLVLPGRRRASRCIEEIKTHAQFRDLPVVVYTGKDLTSKEERLG